MVTLSFVSMNNTPLMRCYYTANLEALRGGWNLVAWVSPEDREPRKPGHQCEVKAEQPGYAPYAGNVVRPSWAAAAHKIRQRHSDKAIRRSRPRLLAKLSATELLAADSCDTNPPYQHAGEGAAICGDGSR